MAKPASVPAWASAATKTTPSAGQKAAGFLAGAKWAAQHANWLTGLISDWIDYLNAGALEGNHSVAGTLGVTGLVTAEASILLTGNYKWTGEKFFGIPITDFASINPSVATNLINTVTTGYFTQNPANISVLAPIVAPAGSYISSFLFAVNQDTAGTVSARLKSINSGTGAVTEHGTLQSSTTEDSYVFLTEDGLEVLVDYEESYFVEIDATHSGITLIQGGFYGVTWP